MDDLGLCLRSFGRRPAAACGAWGGTLRRNVGTGAIAPFSTSLLRLRPVVLSQTPLSSQQDGELGLAPRSRRACHAPPSPASATMPAGVGYAAIVTAARGARDGEGCAEGGAGDADGIDKVALISATRRRRNRISRFSSANSGFSASTGTACATRASRPTVAAPASSANMVLVNQCMKWAGRRWSMRSECPHPRSVGRTVRHGDRGRERSAGRRLTGKVRQ